jgi:hypothetical protein
MQPTLQIEIPGVSGAHLQEEVILLSRLLSGQRDLVVERPADTPIAAGQKGALLSLGTLLVTAAAPEAVKALAEGLKLYFARSRDATIVVTGADGGKVEIKSANLDPDKVVELVARLQTTLAPRA